MGVNGKIWAPKLKLTIFYVWLHKHTIGILYDPGFGYRLMIDTCRKNIDIFVLLKQFHKII